MAAMVDAIVESVEGGGEAQVASATSDRVVEIELGVRVYPVFRVGFFGFFIFRVLNI
jgi:hypothetical protein